MKVLFISGLDGDTRRYRCFHHQEQLALRGVASELREAGDFQLYLDVKDYDVFILHRVPYDELVGDVIELAHLRGKPAIFETDDLIFVPDLYDSIGYVDTLAPETAHRFRRDLARLAETFQCCDGVLTTTEALAIEAQRFDKPAYVHRNVPSLEMVRLSEQACAERRQAERDRSTVIIGYFSGTGSHNRDFLVATPALVQVMQTFPNVWLHVSGHLDLDPAFNPFQSRIRRAPYISWRELPRLNAQVDINLAPLEVDNPFCQVKSEIKFMESALVGIPTIASPTEAFKYAITDGENGLLADSTEEWLAVLTLLVTNPEKRFAIGESARQTVYARYMPEQHSQELLSTLETIVQASSTLVAKPDQFNCELPRRMKRSIDRLLAAQRQQEKQLVDLRQTLAQWETNLLAAQRQQEEQLENLKQALAQSEQEAERRRKADLRKAEQYYVQALRTVLERLQKERSSRFSRVPSNLANNLREKDAYDQP